jgi:hypothetical protein
VVGNIETHENTIFVYKEDASNQVISEELCELYRSVSIVMTWKVSDGLGTARNKCKLWVRKLIGK